MNSGAIGIDLGRAGDGCPLAGTVEESNVDVRVGLKVIGLACLGVGVEDEVDAARFLEKGCVSGVMTRLQRLQSVPTFAATAIHLELSMPEAATRVVIMPNLHDEMNSVRPSTFSDSEGSSLFFALYGSAGLLPVSVLEKDSDILKVRY